MMAAIFSLSMALLCLGFVQAQQIQVPSFLDIALQQQQKCGSFKACIGSRGQMECCPFSNGVCCKQDAFSAAKGGATCCPSGHRCNGQLGCTKLPASGDDLLFTPSSSRRADVQQSKKLHDVICPDGASRCPDDWTCCLTTTEGYGCCSMPEAVCCADKEHCCPKGTACDVEKGRCVPPFGKYFPRRPFFSRGSIESLRKQPARALPLPPSSPPKEGGAVKASAGFFVCPDGSSECADGSTCCVMQDGNYGCCPLPRALCCNDGLHCCPEGSECDDQSLRCFKKDSLEALLAIAKSRLSSAKEVPRALRAVWDRRPEQGRLQHQWPLLGQKSKKANDPVICGRHEAYCQQGETCCRQTDGSWGCCPLPDASCCPDGKQCCPHGYICDDTSRHCNPVMRAFMRAPPQPPRPLMKRPAVQLPPSANLKSVVCPDGTSVCPDDYTCCQLLDLSWGCCPIVDAVCCDDHVHCCPHGYVCNTAATSCDQQRGATVHRVPLQRKMPSMKQGDLASSVLLQPRLTLEPPMAKPGDWHFCTTPLGQMRFCPLDQGTCCSDGNSCCPRFYACSNGTCIHSVKASPTTL